MPHEFNGKKYERVSAHQKEWGAKLIAELSLSGHEHVLDLGCGDGTNTARLADLLPNGNVLGIDASTGMIAAARPKERANLRFDLMDINAMAFTNTFDLIYSNATLHWVKNHDRLLNSVFNALKPGGCVRFNFAADGNCKHFFTVVRQAMHDNAFSGCFEHFAWPWFMPTVDAYRQVVDDTPFREVRVWGENADRFFPGTDALVGWLDQPSLVPFLAALPDSRRSAFRDFVVAKMIRETRQADGRCFETFRRINLFARR